MAGVLVKGETVAAAATPPLLTFVTLCLKLNCGDLAAQLPEFGFRRYAAVLSISTNSQEAFERSLSACLVHHQRLGPGVFCYSRNQYRVHIIQQSRLAGFAELLGVGCKSQPSSQSAASFVRTQQPSSCKQAPFTSAPAQHTACAYVNDTGWRGTP